MRYMEKWTYEKVKEYIESFGYKLLSTEYINNRTKLLLECPNGHKWEVRFSSFRDGTRCNYCFGNIKYTYDYVKEYVKSKGFILISKEYKRARDKIEIECCKCGYRFTPTFDNFKNKNTGCPSCLGIKKYTYKEIKEYIENFGYELIDQEYSNCRKKMEVRCPQGHIFKTNFDTFKNKNCRCPICNESKGERKISDYFDKNNIIYNVQKTFPDLLGEGGGHLSYDFYLPQYNLLIEYQGGFHDGTVTGSYQKYYDLERQQEHDKRKQDYAEKNNIKLLEIWYWDYDNIEEILKEMVK